MVVEMKRWWVLLLLLLYSFFVCFVTSAALRVAWIPRVHILWVLVRDTGSQFLLQTSWPVCLGHITGLPHRGFKRQVHISQVLEGASQRAGCQLGQAQMHAHFPVYREWSPCWDLTWWEENELPSGLFLYQSTNPMRAHLHHQSHLLQGFLTSKYHHPGLHDFNI